MFGIQVINRLLLTLGLVLGLSHTVVGETLNGAGATFPYPLYSQWFYTYEKTTGIKINYQSIGSGAGIKQVIEGTVDFGASDAPLKEEELKKHNLIQFPMVGGAIAIVYNVPGVQKGLRLSPESIADIYLGKLTRWDDQKIKAENPNIKLPPIPIIVVHRADGSGTTNIFTWFLSDVSKDWKDTVGSGTSVKWHSGIGGKGNEGVAGLVRGTRGAIGYVELAYATQTGMTYAEIRNRDGNYVEPSIETTQKASASATITESFYIKFTYSKGKDSYPIAGFTYLILRKAMDKAKLNKIVKFVEWAYKNGNQFAVKLYYVPLSQELKTKVLEALRKL
ncbi:MAG: phosphate ABC transporter substrate-binding protein PstS [Nitrospirae bacterium]|nr:phosphate ABC transporter substrate-binding protein PstS [Nitrospirota bacterium]